MTKRIDLGKLVLASAACIAVSANAQQGALTNPEEGHISTGSAFPAEDEGSSAQFGATGERDVTETDGELDDATGAAGERDATGTAGGLAGTRTAAAADAPRFSAELKPLTTLFATVPGTAAIGVGAEMMVTPTIAAFGNINFIDSSLPNRVQEDAREANEITPEELTGRSGNLGARFYGAPAVSTWYTGVSAGFLALNGEFSRNDERVGVRTQSFTPAIEGGYRWLFGNNFLIRAGLVAAANLPQTVEVDRRGQTGENIDEAAREVEKAAELPFLGTLDLGLGMAF